jgi:hypothetical protein
VNIYSEVDEVNHGFRVKTNTPVRQVFEEFYKRTGGVPGELDRFKCETSGEDLVPHGDLTIGQLVSSGLCNLMTWIFTNRPIRIFVDTQPKKIHKKELSFAEVVALAYDEQPPKGANWAFTVGYSHGPRANPEGSLTKGHSVKIKDGMRFDVSATNES